MIQHIRKIANALQDDLVDDLLSRTTPSSTAEVSGGRDESLEVLVKYAMRTTTAAEADAGRIWQRLRHRMSGPFGQLAVEGPANGDGVLSKDQPDPFAVKRQPKSRARQSETEDSHGVVDFFNVALLKATDTITLR